MIPVGILGKEISVLSPNLFDVGLVSGNAEGTDFRRIAVAKTCENQDIGKLASYLGQKTKNQAWDDREIEAANYKTVGDWSRELEFCTHVLIERDAP